ncbi:hypothetical protein J9253_02860 [Thiothrix litoralis]|uniref:Uncharacterized protein n=1 Tax=Thiothrix litoralis TaxID=2891210 RepID=A0ABX7WUJ0_9GAMM|nr:hypothetical protein [Thiothrix litoralis]QTR46902.1 hypothetical protein J9253_02860 [Thiothrix litoralis]
MRVSADKRKRRSDAALALHPRPEGRGFTRKTDKAFCYPGVESDGYTLKQHQTQAVYDMALLTQTIDARSLLSQKQAQTAAITTLEQRKLGEWLSGTAPRKQSHVGLQHFIQTPAMALNDHHAKHNRFRRAHSNLLCWMDEEKQWSCREEVNRISLYTSPKLM